MNRNRLIEVKKRLVVAKGDGGYGMHLEFVVSACKLLSFKWINNEVLLYGTGNYIKSLGRDHNGR